jgi:vacuolar-type H+-ATPase subunit H
MRWALPKPDKDRSTLGDVETRALEILKLAQVQADAHLAAARQEAEEIVAAARREAEEILANARREGRLNHRSFLRDRL